MLVSRGLSLMLTKQNCQAVVGELYSRLSLSDQNTLHGGLCVVERTLQDREKLVTTDLGGAQPLSVLALRLHLEKWWMGTRCVH